MTTLTETANEGFAPVSGTQAIDFLGLTIVGSALKRFVAFVQLERQAAAERLRITCELNTYSDRGLAELGLSRADIGAVAAGNYRA